MLLMIVVVMKVMMMFKNTNSDDKKSFTAERILSMQIYFVLTTAVTVYFVEIITSGK